MAVGGPELEFGIPACFQADRELRVAEGDLQVRDGLRMAPIEAFGQPDDGREQAHDLAPLLGQQLEALV